MKGKVESPKDHHHLNYIPSTTTALTTTDIHDGTTWICVRHKRPKPPQVGGGDLEGKPEVSKKPLQGRSKAVFGPNRFEVLAPSREEGNDEVETSSR